MQSDHVLCIVRYIFRTLSIIINLDVIRDIHVLFRHIQPYCGTFRILRNSCIFRTLPHSKSQRIQNQIYIQNSVNAYSGISTTLCNERQHIVNPAIFRILVYLGPDAYSESCLYRHIQAYSKMIVIITLTFFFRFNLTYF